VRFISISDNYDNINVTPDELFLISFKNFAHAHFAKETSKKAITAKRSLQEKGLFIGSKAPYGYKKDPNDKHKLIIDENAAPIVRELFKRYISGESYKSMWDDLNRRNVPTPTGKGVWKNGMINPIIQSERYIGTMVQHKVATAFYRNEPLHKVPENEQFRIPNVIPPIIDKDTWEKAKARFTVSIRQRNLLDFDDIPKNIFKGLLFCGKCGHGLVLNVDKRQAKTRQNPYYFCPKCGKRVTDYNKVLATLPKNLRDLKFDELTDLSDRNFLKNTFEKIIINENGANELVYRQDDYA
jgi:hypothetical protein